MLLMKQRKPLISLGLRAGGTLTIPAEIDGYPVVRIAARAFSDHAELTEVILPDSIQQIGDEAFQRCSYLTTINIPSSVRILGSGIFFGCRALEEITVEEENLYFADQNGVLFSKNMERLIVYPVGKTDEKYSIPSGVKVIDNSAFYYSQLNSVVLPDSVSTIGISVFAECENLQEIVLSSSLKSIGGGSFSKLYKFI